MGNNKVLCATLISAALLISNSLQAAVIRFGDSVVVGSSSHGVNTNSDSIDDVIFSTTDPLGFSNENPYLDNPEFYADYLAGAVLGISTNNNIRVDFVNGVRGFAFNYAFLPSSYGDNQVRVDVFDNSDSLLGSSSSSKYGPSLNINYAPNSIFYSSFLGTASYALINASGNGLDRFGIDDFQSTFSPNDRPELNFSSAIPIPATVWLFAPVILGLAGIRRRKK